MDDLANDYGHTTIERVFRVFEDGILVHDEKIKLGLFLAFALVAPPDDPTLEQYEQAIRQFENIVLDRSELLAA